MIGRRVCVKGGCVDMGRVEEGVQGIEAQSMLAQGECLPGALPLY